MTDFTVKLADVNIAVTAQYESTKTYCKDYLTNEIADIAVTVTKDDILREEAQSIKEEQLEGLPHVEYRHEYLETLALYRNIVVKLLDYNVLLFHGAAIEADGRGIIFTAKSGTGKTTHIRLWYELAKKRGFDCGVVNGDKPLIRVTDDGIILYGTPWQGKEGYGTNTSVRLDSIVVLNRGEKNEIRPIPPAEAIPHIFRQSYRPSERDKMAKTLAIIGDIAKKVRFFSLSCNMDIEAAEVSYSEIMK